MAKHHDIERLKALTDGVIAVSITLLVLDIHLTPPLASLSEAAITAQFIAIWPKYFAYVTSFLVVGVSWMSHQRKFSRIIHANATLVWLNFLYLMVVCLVPFTTAVIAENSGRAATTIYAALMLVSSFLLWFMWYYAGRSGFIDSRLSAGARRHESALGVLSMSVFGLSMLIAQWSADTARVLFFLLLFPSMLWRAPGDA